MLPRKKILFIMHLPPPIHGASMIGKYIYDSKIINDQFDCKYINLSASSNVEEIGKFSLKKLIFLITNTIKVFITVLKDRPDLCYITPTSDGIGFYRDFILTGIIKLCRTKIILHFHNKSSKEWSKKRLNKLLLKHFFRRVKIILLGKELYAEKSPYISQNNIYYCPNGIPSKTSLKYREQNKKEKTNFLFLSNMMKEKGVYILLEACYRLKEKGYDFKCDFVGDWKDISQQEFNQYITSKTLQEHVKSHGAQYDINKLKFLKQADVFVFPTYYHGETFGLVLLEAMDFSLPCISTYNGAIPSVIENNKTGFCIHQNNVDELVEKMIWMIIHPLERKNMGMEGKKRFEEKFTLEKFENNLFSILIQCLKS